MDYTSEVSRTYKFLFDRDSTSRKAFRDFQKKYPDLAPLIPSMRERRRTIGGIWSDEGEFSPVLARLRGPVSRLNKPTYDTGDFHYFSERLLILEHHLRVHRPSSLRQLMRDSRDQLQYYTFVTAIIIFVATIFGLILAVLQTVASFWQVQLAMKGP